MDKKIVLVFDGDDTLWMVEWQYSKAHMNFFNFLYEEFRELMPTSGLVYSRFFEIERELSIIWGVERGRMSLAMQKTYQELIQYFRENLGENSDRFKEILGKQPEHEKQIFKIGDQPFDFYELKWVDGAEQVLLDLRSDNMFTLCLLTSYDARVWRDKSKYLRVERFFDRNRIKTVSGRKTKHDFVDVSQYWRTLHKSRFCAIGNTEGDILPALEISPLWRGIYIPYVSSSPVLINEKGADIYIPAPIQDDRVLTISSIKDMLSVDFENICAREARPF